MSKHIARPKGSQWLRVSNRTYDTLKEGTVATIQGIRFRIIEKPFKDKSVGANVVTDVLVLRV